MRTFMCVPLGDRGGVVEWVLNTQTYNSILKGTYASFNVPAVHISPMHSRTDWEAAKKLTLEPRHAPTDPTALLRWFQGKCKQVQPVLHEWWLTQCVIILLALAPKRTGHAAVMFWWAVHADRRDCWL